MTNLRTLTGFVCTMALCSGAFAFTLSDLEAPESMIVDPETGAYYVSNMNGDPLVKDGNGYISKITPNGNTLIQKFIGGKPEHLLLDAPKGICLNGNDLYVADIDKIKIFDKESGKLLRTLDFSKWHATYLNDLTLDPLGSVYVSDRVLEKIFKVDLRNDFAISIFCEDKKLGQPTGLILNPRTRNLMVVTYGSGRILEIDGAGRIHALKRGLKTLNGIDYDVEGNLFVSSIENGEVYKIPFYGRGALSTYLSGLNTPADISYDRKKFELLVPSLEGNTVTTYARPQESSSSGKTVLNPARQVPVVVTPQRAK